MNAARRFFSCWALAWLATTHGLAQELVLAGGNELFVIDAKAGEAGTVTKLWRWSGADAPDLPEEARREFLHLDECKPVENGTKLLVCASNGGCALIERASGRILWRARVRNAHSLCLLPGNRVVVASSLSGDQLEVHDLARSGGAPLFKTPLRSAHGVVWDEQRRCLWAIGFKELHAYTLEAWAGDHPTLKLKQAYPLPDEDAHDLLPVPGTAQLLITTEHAVHLFDRDLATFKPHPVLGDEAKVKSVDIHPETGRIAMSVWGATVRLFEPAGKFQFKDARPYKARWLPMLKP